MRERKARRFLFQNYWWIAFAVIVVAIAVVLKSGATDRGGLIATTVGTALTFCYFVQKQKLDELRLFNELFTNFNRRYDAMNTKLEHIHAGMEMTDAELKIILSDYFNLCAEEFLFAKEGYVHAEVWQSWCRGMLYYLGSDRIRRTWDLEMISESYYGLTMGEIERGAA